MASPRILSSEEALSVRCDQRNHTSLLSICLFGFLGLALCLTGIWLSSYSLIFFSMMTFLFYLLSLYRYAKRNHKKNCVQFDWKNKTITINEISMWLQASSRKHRFDDYMAVRSAVLHLRSEGYRYELSLIGKSGDSDITIAMMSLQRKTAFGGLSKKDILEPQQGHDLRNMLAQKMPVTDLGFNPTFFSNPALD